MIIEVVFMNEPTGIPDPLQRRAATQAAYVVFENADWWWFIKNITASARRAFARALLKLDRRCARRLTRVDCCRTLMYPQPQGPTRN